jgi:hypothetical protein
MANNMLGVTGVQVEAFNLWAGHSKLNEFLKKHDGKIVDIQIIKSVNDVNAYVIYKES